MKTVFVLLSTYNGEKYLQEQLESLLAQDYPNLVIHVRDDGSQDGTLEILRSYEKAGKICLHTGTHAGFIQSFNWLLQNCTGADAYAWCDQDDIWLPGKVSMAVAAMEAEENRRRSTGEQTDVPILYVSDFDWVDQDGRKIRRENAGPLPHNLEKRIIRSDFHAFGFTQLFNEACARGIRERAACVVMPHDDTVYLYCLACGCVLWGDQPAACFRRHGRNASAQEKKGGFWAHLRWQIHYFLFEFDRDAYYERDREFYTVFRDALPEKARASFERCLRPGHRLQKVCFPGRYQDGWVGDIGARMLFLLGKL